MSARWTYVSPPERWSIADATSTGKQTYGGRFGAWYTNQDILRVVGSLLKSLSDVSNGSIIEQVGELVGVLIEMLVQLKTSGYELRNLPSLSGVVSDDGSFLVEWISHNFRVGFVFEVDPKESMWYLVTKEQSSGSNLSGALSGPDKKETLTKLASFVISNS